MITEPRTSIQFHHDGATNIINTITSTINRPIAHKITWNAGIEQRQQHDLVSGSEVAMMVRRDIVRECGGDERNETRVSLNRLASLYAARQGQRRQFYLLYWQACPWLHDRSKLAFAAQVLTEGKRCRGLEVVGGEKRLGESINSTSDLKAKVIGHVPAPSSRMELSLSGHHAFNEALTSALTKFDSLDSYFASGLNVQAVAAMLSEEMMADKDADVPADELLLLLKRAVGTARGSWLKQNPGTKIVKAKPVKDNPLPWPSIDAYPVWVVGMIDNYINLCNAHLAGAGWSDVAVGKHALEHMLLAAPLCSATVKFDGTCFGVLDSGELVGRKQLLGRDCDEYQKTNVAAAASCDVKLLREVLQEMVGSTQLASVCVWGELMCNPHFYSYAERGLYAEWLAFGVVANVAQPFEPGQLETFSSTLARHGLKHSISLSQEAEHGTVGPARVRLLLCPALQQLLTEVTGCRVAHDMHDTTSSMTHAEMVSRAADGLIAGTNEGVVVTFEKPDHGMSSIRKWKNSAEGSSVSTKHAQQLRRCKARCTALAVSQPDQMFDARVIEMVDILISVAEADTNPDKKGRKHSGAQGN